MGSNEDLTVSLQKFAARNEWEMDSCSDSFNAIQKVKNAPYDMIVMDQDIAPLDPFKLMEYISHELQKVLAMVVVGNQDSNNATSHGTYLKLAYPISEEDLDKMVTHMDLVPKTEKQTKVFSLDYLIKLSDNNEEFIQESIQLFLESVSAKLEELKTAITDGNYNAAREIAHNVKPTFAMLGNDKGRDICDIICHDAEDAEIPDLAKSLEDESILITNELEKEFPQLKQYEKENLDYRG